MKHISFLLFHVIISIHVIGQSSVFSTLNTRKVYVGIKNTVNVAVPGVKCDSIDLQYSDCQISGEGCIYDIIPQKVGLLNFYVIKKGTGQVLDSVKIFSGNLPEPIIKLGNGEGGERLIRKGPQVNMESLFPTNFALDLRIIDFDLKIKRGNKIIYSGKNSGPLYTTQFLEHIEKCIPNDMIIVENVRIAGINDLKWKLERNSQIYDFILAKRMLIK